MEFCVLHDGTHGVDTNRYILVMDSGSSPQAPDIKATMRHQSAKKVPHCGLTVDVDNAHKRLAVRPEDWPLAACQVYPEGGVYLNKRGTFGIASAAYWWGRLAAALRRFGLLVLGPLLPLWVLLFAGDFNLTAEGREFARSLLAFVWWLVLFRVPLGWKKSQGGLAYSWVGFELSLREWPLGISASRAAWVDGVHEDAGGGTCEHVRVEGSAGEDGVCLRCVAVRQTIPRPRFSLSLL